MDEKRYAVLIDSDNISAKYIALILDEMTKYGVITYKRIYGDWTSTQANKWKNELLENSITPIQQFNNTVGKNATDSALIIDAMDILYTKNVDGFCIVSSDGDFTRLASRLRESGMEVIGMGENKTPRSFRAACSVFTNLEILLEQDEEGDDNRSVIAKTTIETAIREIITENENKGRQTGLGELGSRLLKKYSDFDVRNYGYSSLSKFLEEMDGFTLTKINSTFLVSNQDNEDSREKLNQYVISCVRQAGKNGMELGVLGQRVHKQYPDFKVKDFGYSAFIKFVQSIKELEVRENKQDSKMVYLVGEV
ncbi:MAG: NYN domain-containing protein [Clostridiales bacterium]|nr:NYN domain-containing protein [Clostridiales bacterium]